VVPSDGQVEVEVTILNRDMARIQSGATVAVKLEAFSFTRYGTVPGKLLWVSRDAVQDEKLGPIFQARVRLERNWILVDGRRMPLSPGLAATADIRTGARSILSYLLSPVARSIREAGHED
jgi:hemolysin D